ncbi:MAG: MFS transporter [Syntrophobacteraceae bacterium]
MRRFLPQFTREPDFKKILAWSLYDWGNSAFSTTIMAGFFPVFFKEFWSAGTDVSESTFKLGVANSLASLVIFALAPFLGAAADQGRCRKRFLLAFAGLGILMSGALTGVGKGDWQTAALFYALATIGFSGSIIFYDSLLVHVAPADRTHFVSALGYSLGYLGGGILFALNVLMTLAPARFGLADASEAVRASFLTVSIWWAAFSIPLLLYVPEIGSAGHCGSAGVAFRDGMRQLAATFREIRKLRVVLLFLVAYWFYIDGVDTVIRMAVDYGLSLGFSAKNLLLALLITQFVGFPAAIAFGWIGERIGPKTGIYIGIAVYFAVTVWAYFMNSDGEFYAMAIAIGLVQGGIQSLSRSLYARIIPRDKSAEFFGFYNMLGKFAAVMGPFLMGVTSLLTGKPRSSILALGVLFAIGAGLLTQVRESEGAKLARELEDQTSV